jgi:ribosomal protein S18 acetylase RimI-like enzyme
MSTLIIRIASNIDAELIADISRQTFYETFASHNTQENMDIFMTKQFSKQQLIKEVGSAGNIFLLAYEENEVAGYVRLKETTTKQDLNEMASIEICRLYAITKKIGKGIGSFLMQQSLDLAKKMNKKKIWLGVWEKNYRAIDFYKKWGFEIFSEQDFILGNDIQKDWLMQKYL